MRFGILQQHPGEYKTGLFFEKYPEIKTKERGRLFKYKDADRTHSMEDVVTNLAHEMVIKTISTTYSLPWKSEAYVLLGDELWRITGFSESAINQQVAAIVRNYGKEYSITIRRVSNATEMQR